MSQDNVTLVRGMYEAFQRGDIEAIAAIMAPDAEWQVMGRPEDYPTFGKWTGPGGVRDFFRLVADTQDMKEFTTREFLGLGDHVVVTGHYEWVVRNTGSSFDAEWCHLLTVTNGKVTRFREFTDTASFADAFSG